MGRPWIPEGGQFFGPLDEMATEVLIQGKDPKAALDDGGQEVQGRGRPVLRALTSPLALAAAGALGTRQGPRDRMVAGPAGLSPGAQLMTTVTADPAPAPRRPAAVLLERPAAAQLGQVLVRLGDGRCRSSSSSAC